MNYLKVPVVAALIVLSSLNLATASHQGPYPEKRKHEGRNIQPRAAFEQISQNQNHFIVDVRTRYEYQDIGHPERAYHVPLLFYAAEVGPKGYRKVFNKHFCRDLKSLFSPKRDTLYMICRSGERSSIAVQQAISCGFESKRVFNILGGFEGDKVHEKDSPFYGKRTVAGWRLEGLPWTYSMDKKYMYKPDLSGE